MSLKIRSFKLILFVSFQLVKIHATESTNEDLKVRFRESEPPQLTTLYTNHQMAGKGQMGAKWLSEPRKNLTFSILISDLLDGLTDFEINKWVAVTVVEWLRQKLQIQAVIKWPNDILSVNHKLGGILIENILQNGKRQATIIGIGLNINQTDFQELPKAISLKQITGKSWDLEGLLIDFMTFLENSIQSPQESIDRYESLLFKLGRKTTFQCQNEVFEALVQGVTPDGKLRLSVKGTEKTYGLKEVFWIY
ncbi:hypothetical protein AAU57_05920 [Nonlabens sp. YIK11]|nr:hypothetical protein AAU57_05920 [Nonlabens sp. YIK11]